MYYNLVGGVLALNREQLKKTNGFSNLYWGWGMTTLIVNDSPFFVVEMCMLFQELKMMI